LVSNVSIGEKIQMNGTAVSLTLKLVNSPKEYNPKSGP